jgi:hypothetical protein
MMLLKNINRSLNEIARSQKILAKFFRKRSILQQQKSTFSQIVTPSTNGEILILSNNINRNNNKSISSSDGSPAVLNRNRGKSFNEQTKISNSHFDSKTAETFINNNNENLINIHKTLSKTLNEEKLSNFEKKISKIPSFKENLLYSPKMSVSSISYSSNRNLRKKSTKIQNNINVYINNIKSSPYVDMFTMKELDPRDFIPSHINVNMNINVSNGNVASSINHTYRTSTNSNFTDLTPSFSAGGGDYLQSQQDDAASTVPNFSNILMNSNRNSNHFQNSPNTSPNLKFKSNLIHSISNNVLNINNSNLLHIGRNSNKFNSTGSSNSKNLPIIAYSKNCNLTMPNKDEI